MTECPLCLNPTLKNYFKDNKTQALYYQCETCAYVCLDQELRLLPEDEGERYLLHENEVSDLGYQKFLNRLIDPLVPLLVPAGEGLDYGSGPTVALATLMRAKGFKVSVYDVYFAKNFSVLNRAYDFITCTEVIEHLYKPADNFMLFDKLLKPKGWLAIMTEVLPETLEKFDSWYYRRDPTHVGFFSQKTYEYLAMKYSWQLRVIEPRVVFFQKTI